VRRGADFRLSFGFCPPPGIFRMIVIPWELRENDRVSI
jgi:hypothetical protein